MNMIRFLPILALLTFSSTCPASNTQNESDAMQITTHFNDLTGIACDNTAQYCVAVGTAVNNRVEHIVYTTRDGGITWNHDTTLSHPDQEDKLIDTVEPLSSDQVFTTVRCDMTGTDCLIAATASISGQPTLLTYTSHDAGHNWSKPFLINVADQTPARAFVDDYPFLRLKCNANASWCILAGNTVSQQQHTPVFFTTQNLGESWSSATYLSVPSNVPYGLDVLDLGCDSSGLICTAVTSTQDSFDGKQTSQPPHMGLIYSTHDGGNTWSDAKPLMISRGNQDAVAAPNDVINILTCDQSGLSCIALGTSYTVQHTEDSIEILDNPAHSYLTKNGGLSWQDASEISADKDYTQSFTALDCDVSNRFCAAVGIKSNDKEEDSYLPIIHTTTDGGQTWQKKPLTPPENASSFMLDVFCSEDASFCHTVGFFLKAIKHIE
ncbi:MAG: hypothetical protein NTU48_03625 [Legionellales bacterium]|nr:hypothetical protein [Legionellales bacterium]